MKVIPIQPEGSATERPRVRPQSVPMPDEQPPQIKQTIFINGQPVSAQAIAQEAQNHPMPQHKPGWAWHAAAQALVWRQLFLLEAQKRGLAPDPVELEPGLWETDEEALIRQLFDEAIEPADVPEAQLRAHYDAHRERYRGPSLYEAAHILFVAPEDDPAARTDAQARAQAVREQLENNPKRFAQLAKEHSDCPSAAQGGLMGQLASGDVVPEFEAILRQLDEGEISGPMETRYGVHIVRLDQRALGQPLPYESVRPQLRQAEEKAHWVRAGKMFMQQLLERNEVTGIDMHLSPWHEEQ